MNAPKRFPHISTMRAPLLLLIVVWCFSLAAPALTGHASGLEYGLYLSFQQLAIYGLVCVAIGLTMLLGEFDVSVLGLWPLAAVIAITSGESNPLLGIAAAVGCGAVVGALHAAVIRFAGITGLVVTFATAIVMTGIAEVMTDGLSVASSNYTLGVNLSAPIMRFFSWHTFLVLAIITTIGVVLRFSRLGPEVLATGADRRASVTVGVRVHRLTFGVFTLSGMLVGLAAALTAYVQAFADPLPAWTPVMFAMTAVLIGGVHLHGGHGTVLGMMVGAFTLSVLQSTFTTMQSELWVPITVQGILLLLVAITTAPALARSVDRRRARRAQAARRRVQDRGHSTPTPQRTSA